MKLHCPPHIVCPSPLLQSTLPCLGPSRGPPPSGLWSPEEGPCPQPPLSAPGPAHGSRAALGMLRGGAGAGSLRRRSHSAAGGRARSAAGARRPELELPGVSLPLRPLRARQLKPARELREAASQPPTRTAVSGARSPARGSPRRGASLAGTACLAGALPGHEPGFTVWPGRGERAGEAEARPGGMRLQQPQRSGLRALGVPGAPCSRRWVRGGRLG